MYKATQVRTWSLHLCTFIRKDFKKTDWQSDSYLGTYVRRYVLYQHVSLLTACLLLIKEEGGGRGASLLVYVHSSCICITPYNPRIHPCTYVSSARCASLLFLPKLYFSLNISFLSLKLEHVRNAFKNSYRSSPYTIAGVTLEHAHTSYLLYVYACILAIATTGIVSIHSMTMTMTIACSRARVLSINMWFTRRTGWQLNIATLF